MTDKEQMDGIALAALQGILSSGRVSTTDLDTRAVAEKAYDIAHSMMYVRRRRARLFNDGGKYVG